MGSAALAVQPDDLIPNGAYSARLVRVFDFRNAFGDRIGFEFSIEGGLVLASAAPSTNPRSKLAEILKGLLGRDVTLEDLQPARYHALAGSLCRVLVRQERNRSGRSYAAVQSVFQ